MNNGAKELQEIGREHEWDAEQLMANPSLATAITTVAVGILAFLALSWVTEAILHFAWAQVIVALLVAVYLVQSAPTDLVEDLSFDKRLRMNIPVWTARTVLLVVLFFTYYTMLDLTAAPRWLFVIAMTFIVAPLMWLELLQMRPFGMLSMIGLLAPMYLPAITLICSTQVGLWALATAAWFLQWATLGAVILTVAAVTWHLVGNAILMGIRTRATPL